MATDFAPPVMSGLMIPDPRIITANLDAADSTYSQAGPYPGAVVSQDTPRSAMTFRSSGAQSPMKALRLRCGRGGYPGVDGGAGGLLWQNEGDTDWYGWDPYQIFTGWEWVTHIADAVTAEANDPHVIPLSSNAVFCAHHYAATGAADDVVYTKTLTPGGTWSAPVSVTPTIRHAALHPCAVQLPDESILLLYWVTDTVGALAQIQVQRSTDGGATWALATTFALKDAVSTTTYTIGKLRVAYNNGSILLTADLMDGGLVHRLAQFASDDDGASFSTVEVWSSDVGRSFEPLALPDGGFLIVYVVNGTSNIESYKIGTAYQPATTGVAVTVSLQGDQECTAFVGQDGLLWVANVDGAGASMMLSTDGGATWTDATYSVGADSSTLIATGSSNQGLIEPSACALQGRMVLVGKTLSTGGNSNMDDNSIVVVYGGGSSTHTAPPAKGFSRTTDLISFRRTWWAFDEPDQFADYARQASGGSETDVLSVSGLTVTTSGPDHLYYEDTTAHEPSVNDVASSVGVQCELSVTSGGSVSSTTVALRILNADGTDDYEVMVRFSLTQFRVLDINGASTIGTVSVDMTSPVQFRFALGAGSFRCKYRTTTNPSDSARAWVDGPSSDAVTNDAATPNAQANVSFGNLNSPVAGSDVSVWRMLHVMTTAITEAGWEADQSNPADVFPRPISRHAIGIDDGVKVEAIDGPCYEGETWNVDTRYQYGVECMDPTIHPSPQRKHRTTDETQHEYAWDLHGLTANSRLGVQTVALYLEGINWRSGELFGKTNGGAYVSLGTIDSAVNRNGLKYSLVGDVVTVNTATTTDAAEYIHYNDFAGGTFFLADGKPRKIIRHTEGSWTDQLTRRPEFFLEGIDGTEATTGTVGAIWSPRLLVVVHNLQEYRHLKLRVDAQTTADGYLETGIATIGPVHIFGQGYSWGRRVTVTPNGSLTTRRDGSRVARRNGAPRMAVDLAWRDGVNEWTLYPTAGGNPVPNYMTGTSTGGTQPIATPYDTAHKVQGIAHELAEDMPCVYIPRIDRGTPDLVQYASRWDMLYGRIRGPVGLENIIGDSRAGEIWRIATVRIEQEQ